MKNSFLTTLILSIFVTLQAQQAILYLKDGGKVPFNVQVIKGNLLRDGNKQRKCCCCTFEIHSSLDILTDPNLKMEDYWER